MINKHLVEIKLRILKLELFLGQQFSAQYTFLRLSRAVAAAASPRITTANRRYTDNLSVFHFQLVVAV